MGKKLKGYILQIGQMVAMVVLVSWAVDKWREPVVPVNAYFSPMHTLDGELLDWAKISQDTTVVVYFWGSWCGVCRHTSPTIERLHQVGVKVIGVPMQSGSAAQVQTYMRQHGWHFVNVDDVGQVLAQQWQVKVAPTIVLIKNGKMVHHTTGLSSYWGLRGRVAWVNAWYQ